MTGIKCYKDGNYSKALPGGFLHKILEEVVKSSARFIDNRMSEGGQIHRTLFFEQMVGYVARYNPRLAEEVDELYQAALSVSLRRQEALAAR
jgi:hypothetical protein